ncbi:MAG TPA: cytidine deaminase [Pyrinomonadaceae bacterium]|nr:cytidine deaminase [Pyrinomonadaceae bacterium]
MSSEVLATDLIAAAAEARERAHVPFSHFQVGAALETATGEIVTGCNIENASYGLTLCAERVAIFKAVSEGQRKFTALAVVVDTDELTPPCGACRQIIWEFCGDIPVTMANLKGRLETMRMSELLPKAFDAGFLDRT